MFHFFFALGAGHFLGEHSIIHYMQKEGFQIARMSSGVRNNSNSNNNNNNNDNNNSNNNNNHHNQFHNSPFASIVNSPSIASGNIQSALAASLRKEAKMNQTYRTKNRKKGDSINPNRVKMISRIQLNPEDEDQLDGPIFTSDISAN